MCERESKSEREPLRHVLFVSAYSQLQIPAGLNHRNLLMTDEACPLNKLPCFIWAPQLFCWDSIRTRRRRLKIYPARRREMDAAAAASHHFPDDWSRPD
jgi:hypothetical protein